MRPAQPFSLRIRPSETIFCRDPIGQSRNIYTPISKFDEFHGECILPLDAEVALRASLWLLRSHPFCCIAVCGGGGSCSCRDVL